MNEEEDHQQLEHSVIEEEVEESEISAPTFPEFIFHPLFKKIREVERIVDKLESVKKPEDEIDYMFDDVIHVARYQYRKKIKGFHLAFNIRDKLEAPTQHIFKVDAKAEELRLHALERKNMRLNN